MQEFAHLATGEVPARGGDGELEVGEWEYAARAGTTTPWWTGAEPQSVEGAGNIADAYAASLEGQSTWQYERWLDGGHFVHAPVGSYRANPPGLHDVSA